MPLSFLFMLCLSLGELDDGDAEELGVGIEDLVLRDESGEHAGDAGVRRTARWISALEAAAEVVAGELEGGEADDRVLDVRAAAGARLEHGDAELLADERVELHCRALG